MKFYENPWKSMKIDRKRWKSSDDKKPAWNRAKVSIGAAGCFLRRAGHPHPEIMKIHQNSWKSMKIEPWKSMENDESPQMTRSQPGIESSKGFYRGSRLFLKAAQASIPRNHENPSKFMKIYENQWKSITMKNQWKTMKVLRWQEASMESSKGFYRGSRF